MLKGNAWPKAFKSLGICALLEHAIKMTVDVIQEELEQSQIGQLDLG